MDLKKLAVSNVGKKNIDYGSLHYEKYFTKQLGGRLIVLDISGMVLLVKPIVFIMRLIDTAPVSYLVKPTGFPFLLLAFIIDSSAVFVSAII